MSKRVTILDIQKMKQQGEPIPVITAYDYTSAQMVDQAGIPMIIVGDSLGMVVLGHTTTIPVTLDEMIHHARAVVRGNQQALIVGDMPFLTYTTPQQALQSAGRFLQEAGVQAVKIEGGRDAVPIVQALVHHGIPVLGHIGFTPQSVHQSGTRVQGKRAEDARRLIDDAHYLEDAGVFALILELVPRQLAEAISTRLRIPTIGIGAGVGCDGQVQVWHDLLGMFTDFVPRHTKPYVKLAPLIHTALQEYAEEVRNRSFPTDAHSSAMREDELQEALMAQTPPQESA